VVERAVRLIEVNRERFAKRILAGPAAAGRLILAPDTSDEVVRARHLFAAWPDDGATRAVLARTNAELRPAVVVAVELGLPFRAPGVELLVESPQLDGILDAAARTEERLPLLARLARVREQLLPVDRAKPASDAYRLAGALIAWAAPFRDLDALTGAIVDVRSRLAELRRDDAQLTLATAHGTKGLEWDHVAVIGLEVGRFPSRRSVEESDDPDRALEEERRLAYVAWTRARRSLTLLYDPTAPSPFLLEAFSPAELGLESAPRAATMPR
jgi:superfamily I DNA/RNA helicase